MSAQPQQPQERTWASLCHLAGLGLFLLPSFGNLIGPLVIWLVKRETSPFVDDQGKEAINFQLSCTIYAIGAGILMLALIGFLLMPALGIFWLVEVILASISASNGTPHRYPLSIRFIK